MCCMHTYSGGGAAVMTVSEYSNKCGLKLRVGEQCQSASKKVCLGGGTKRNDYQ